MSQAQEQISRCIQAIESLEPVIPKNSYARQRFNEAQDIAEQVRTTLLQGKAPSTEKYKNLREKLREVGLATNLSSSQWTLLAEAQKQADNLWYQSRYPNQ